jgi:hypothetical protein
MSPKAAHPVIHVIHDNHEDIGFIFPLFKGFLRAM